MEPLQIVAEPKRQEILRLVWAQERSVGEIVSHFDVSFGAVSQHLGVLRDAGMVRVRKEGNRRYYRADHERLGPLKPLLEAMWGAFLDDLAAAVESEE
jgi:DNA-binding transcriptional ArsR family regulator